MEDGRKGERALLEGEDADVSLEKETSRPEHWTFRTWAHT